MSIEIRQTAAEGIERVIPILVLAEQSERALRWSLGHLSDAVYEMTRDGELVAAATVRWEGETSEIIELGVAESVHGQGLGRAFLAWLIDEARRRGKRALEVGTSNASIGNIAFYQKCGFRMNRVKPDYFWYHRPPEIEYGITVRDLLMFRYALTDADESRDAPRDAPRKNVRRPTR